MGRLSPLSTTHYRWLAGLWTLGIVVALSLPPSSFGGAQPAVGVDKVVHFVLFAGFSGLWMRGLCPSTDGTGARYGRRAGALLVVGMLFAAGSEIYQDLLPIRRAGDPYDVLANGAGLLAGLLFYGVLWGWEARPSSGPR